MVINKGQKFNIKYGFDEIDYITFELTKFTYIEEPRKEIKDRFDEINITVKLNELLTGSRMGLTECKTSVNNFLWYYHTLGKMDACFGDVSFQNVNIDFEESDVPPCVITPPPFKSPPVQRADGKKINNVCSETVNTGTILGGTANTGTTVATETTVVTTTSDEEPKPTKEELRQKRLQFFNKF
jgi:hypothetical protein